MNRAIGGILLSAGIALLLGQCGAKKQETPMVLEKVVLEGETGTLGPEKLSEWGLFEPNLQDLKPVPDLMPYEISTSLFTDYAFKSRLVRLPEGQAANYHDSEVFEFPKGSILVKNFYYPTDFSKPEGDRRILETRLLIHEEEEWKALTYVWNDEQTEAFLEIAGKSIPVSWTDEKGVLQNINYAVPNLNQCKSCHELNGRFTPIGPTARQLNRSLPTGEPQLAKWVLEGVLTGLPDHAIPSLPVWEDASSGTLDTRARAWLEVNCAHCHRQEGPAKNTGLYLLTSETDEYRLGIMKTPVAAGRGGAQF